MVHERLQALEVMFFKLDEAQMPRGLFHLDAVKAILEFVIENV
jgi:hypothetical protein